MSDILTRICEDKRLHIAKCQEQRSLESIEITAKQASPARGFAASLNAAVNAGLYGLIAEIKKASPSKANASFTSEGFFPVSIAFSAAKSIATSKY